MAESKGVWLDKETGKVVNKQPARARLLVAPGKDLEQSKVDAIVKRYTQVETATAVDDTEKTVTSKTVK